MQQRDSLPCKTGHHSSGSHGMGLSFCRDILCMTSHETSFRTACQSAWDPSHRQTLTTNLRQAAEHDDENFCSRHQDMLNNSPDTSLTVRVAQSRVARAHKQYSLSLDAPVQSPRHDVESLFALPSEASAPCFTPSHTTALSTERCYFRRSATALT